MRTALALAAFLGLYIPLARSEGSSSSSAARASGITITAVKASGHANAVDIRFVLKNDNKVTVYLRDARTERTQYASLASGGQLYPPSMVGGISDDCGNVQNCMHQPTARELSEYSSVDPGGTLPFSFHYQSGTPLTKETSISFSVALIAMFAKSEADSSNVGPLKSLRFSFVDLPLAD